MAYNGSLTVKMTNDAVDPTNFQLFGFDFNASVGSAADCAAVILAYIYQLETISTFAVNTRIEGISERAVGFPGGVAVAFPVAEYAALVTVDPTLPTVTTYVGTIGAGSLAPLGTSISVSEMSGFVGPQGRGRHFLPFVSSSTVTAGGTLNPPFAGQIEQYYRDWIIGDMLATPLNAVIRGVGVHPITSVKAQPIFSNLATRRR